MEEWRDIPGYEGRYQASNQGRVRSLDCRVRTVSRFGSETTRRVDGRTLLPQKHSQGYQQVTCRGDLKLVHALVLATFVGPCPEGMECAHNDGDKTNNTLANLRYALPKSNANDRRLHGTSGRGEKNASAKLKAEDVLGIRTSGLKQSELALQYGVAQATISKVKRGARWGHL